MRGLSRERNRERGRLRSIARSRSNRRKASWAQSTASPLTGRRRAGSWRRGLLRLLTKDRRPAANAGEGALAVAPTGRQRVPEVAVSGAAPPAEGRRGSFSQREPSSESPRMRRVARPKTASVLCQTHAAEAATAKNRGIWVRERQRELFDPQSGSRRCTKMPHGAASAG
jgi:hypothetical protein